MTHCAAFLSRDYLCGTKLDNYTLLYANVRHFMRQLTFLGKHSRRAHDVIHAIAIYKAMRVTRSRLIGHERSPRVALKFRSAASMSAESAHGMHIEVYFLSDEQSIPANESCQFFTIRALHNNGGKVGRTVSTFQKAVRESCILVDDGTLLVSP